MKEWEAWIADLLLRISETGLKVEARLFSMEKCRVFILKCRYSGLVHRGRGKREEAVAFKEEIVYNDRNMRR